MKELADDNLGSYKPREHKKMKFSSLNKDGVQKEYPITSDLDLKWKAAQAKMDLFEPKAELLQPFDEN